MYPYRFKKEMISLTFHFTYQLIIWNSEYFTENFKGDCLLAVGDEELIKT